VARGLQRLCLGAGPAGHATSAPPARGPPAAQSPIEAARLAARRGQPGSGHPGGLYARSRHANYFGELVFWLGSFVAGLPAILAAGVPLLARARRATAASLGLAGIVFIMLSATKRLEGRQAEKWRPSAAYDKYYLSSNALVPKLL
jgi:hypothetical protein